MGVTHSVVFLRLNLKLTILTVIILKNVLKPQPVLLAALILAGFVLSGCSTTPTPQFSRSALLPVSVTSQPMYSTPHTVYHVVGPAETLWRISKIYNVNIQELARANKLTDVSKLEKGKRLVIPRTYGPRAFIPLYPSTKWSYIIIHHTATDMGDSFSIDRLHLKRGFWNGMGYHFLINNGTEGKTEGQIEVGPRWIKQMDGAHTKADNMNIRGIGISLVGNFSTRRLSRKEFDSLVFLVRTLQKYYGIPSSRVVGHRDVRGANTECPGKLFPWTEFKKRIYR